MYLRVENGETKQVYAFEHKKAVKIGRSQTCDIQLVSEGISRYHVEIHEIDGGFEVVDLGSTNGTYINEERLMPNQATSFNTFFPLKLGHSVYVYLIDSDENQEKVNILNDVLPSGNKENAAEEQETAIHKFENASDIQITRSLQTQKNYKIKKVSSRKKNESKNGQFKLSVAMTLLCVFGYILYDNQDKWLFLIISDQPTTTPAIEIRENKTIQDNKPTASTDTRPINIQKAQNHQILEDAKRSIKNDKCLENEVAEICQIIKATKNRNYYEGAVILNNTLHIVVDFNASYNHFQKYAPKYSKEEEFKALNLLLANPQHYRSIYELKRTGKEVNLYEYQSNIDAKDLKKMSDAIIYAELLFSKLAEVINKSKFDKITFVLYQVNGLDYNYINHWHFDRKFLLFKGHNMENLLFLTKVAIFHGELNNFNSINRNITSEIIR